MGGQGDLGGPGSQKAIGDRCSDKERQTKRMTRRERTRGRRKLSRGARLQTHIPTPHPPPHTHRLALKIPHGFCYVPAQQGLILITRMHLSKTRLMAILQSSGTVLFKVSRSRKTE